MKHLKLSYAGAKAYNVFYMLQTLTVKNYIFQNVLELEFGNTMTVITGESGAGKSILIDALLILLGKKPLSRTALTDASS